MKNNAVKIPKVDVRQIDDTYDAVKTIYFLKIKSCFLTFLQTFLDFPKMERF